MAHAAPDSRIILIPLFVPGISMGVATALFFQILSLKPSLLAIALVQVLWALPFAFLVILTVMANFDEAYLEAAYMSGAGPRAPSSRSNCRRSATASWALPCSR